jgi:hypothetical protein
MYGGEMEEDSLVSGCLRDEVQNLDYLRECYPHLLEVDEKEYEEN